MKIIKKIIRFFRPIYWPFVKAYFLYLSPETRGVRVILTHKGKILFIKNSYGLKYNFPGGNLSKKEIPIDGAKREVKEELGINISKLTLIDTIIPPLEFEYRKNTIYIFTSELSSKDINTNNLEIIDYKWLPVDNPPSMGYVAYQIFEVYKSK